MSDTTQGTEMGGRFCTYLVVKLVYWVTFRVQRIKNQRMTRSNGLQSSSQVVVHVVVVS